MFLRFDFYPKPKSFKIPVDKKNPGFFVYCKYSIYIVILSYTNSKKAMKTLFTRASLLILSLALSCLLATSCVSVGKAIAPAQAALTAPLDGFMIDLEDPKQRSHSAYKAGKEEIDFIYIVNVKDLKFKVLEDISLLNSAGSGDTSLAPTVENLKPGAVIKYPLYNSKGEPNIRAKDLFITPF